MTNDLYLETEVDAGGPPKEWRSHNGLVVLAALGLAALSVLLGWVPNTELFAGTPLWVTNFLSTMGFVLMLAAGTVVGMLVATRMLQAHVGPRGARMLALWGIAAVVLSVLLQFGLLMVNVRLQNAGSELIFAFLNISNLVTATMAIGAAMVALALVGRLRH